MLEVVFIELIRSNLQPIYKRNKNRFTQFFEFVQKYYDENGYLFNLYRVRGWILSGFAPVLLIFPMLILYVSFVDLSLLTPIYLLIFGLLLIPWAIIPALFMFYNPNRNIGIKVVSFIWIGLMLTAAINWLIFIITW
jgi:hypothetical protein